MGGSQPAVKEGARQVEPVNPHWRSRFTGGVSWDTNVTAHVRRHHQLKALSIRLTCPAGAVNAVGVKAAFIEVAAEDGGDTAAPFLQKGLIREPRDHNAIDAGSGARYLQKIRRTHLEKVIPQAISRCLFLDFQMSAERLKVPWVRISQSPSGRMGNGSVELAFSFWGAQ